MIGINEKITVSHDGDISYFHVLGDERRYLDLEALINNHPELDEYCDTHRFELNRGLLQLQEMIETHETDKVL